VTCYGLTPFFLPPGRRRRRVARRKALLIGFVHQPFVVFGRAQWRPRACCFPGSVGWRDFDLDAGMEPPFGLYDPRNDAGVSGRRPSAPSRGRDPILRKADQVLSPMPSSGDAATHSRPSPRSIVGQQISVKAAQSIWNRFAECSGSGDAPPRSAALAPGKAMRACGLSGGKGEVTWHDLASHFLLGLTQAAPAGRG